MRAVALTTRGMICRPSRYYSLISWGLLCVDLEPVVFVPTFIVGPSPDTVAPIYNKTPIRFGSHGVVSPLVSTTPALVLVDPPQVGGGKQADLVNIEPKVSTTPQIEVFNKPLTLSCPSGTVVYNKEDNMLYDKPEVGLIDELAHRDADDECDPGEC